MTAEATTLNYDPTSPLTQADPYPQYAELRMYAPIHWNERFNIWLISRYDDVARILRDPRWSSNYRNSALGADEEKASWRVLLFMDGEEHAQLRRVVTKALGSLIPVLRRQAEETVGRLCDSFEARDEIDLIADFAAPLSLASLATLLGIPVGEVPLLAPRADEISDLIDWTPDPQALNNVQASALSLLPYLSELVRRKRRSPGNDLMSALLQLAKARSLGYLDVVSTCLLLLAAGYVTSTHMLANGILALLRAPQTLYVYKAGAYATSRTVDELLRFDAPVQSTPRSALVDMDVGKYKIHRGDTALLLLGSANRDEHVFANPNMIDPARRVQQALGFGGGPHYCVGAEIARTIGSVALERLLERFDRLSLPPQEFQWMPKVTQRRLRALRVSLR